MASTRTYAQSFAGGEISAEMWGRIGDAKYQAGAATMRNFVATPQGPAETRPGFAYVNATKGSGVARLIPFIYSNDQAVAIELGDHYARFHALGKTLEYVVAGVPAWVPPSGDLTLTYTTPAKITWTAHGLATGDPIRFYLLDDTGNYKLPVGLMLGYTYTVQVIDADNFYIFDGATLVGLQPPPGGAVGPSTNYPGSGSATAYLSLAPNAHGTVLSGVLNGLASTPVPGGVATLNANISIDAYVTSGGGGVSFQYSIDAGANWYTFAGGSSNMSRDVSVPVALSDLDQLELRVFIGGGAGPSGSVNITGSINSWSVDVPSGGSASGGNLRAYRYYKAADLVSYGGLDYYAIGDDGGGTATPGADDGAWWYPEPVDGNYEVPTPWAVADVFDIHYAQSQDVMTLVHPSYPPYELKRLGAAQWSCTKVAYAPSIDPPTNVQVKASQGFKTKVSSLTLANPGIFTTTTNHNLTMGDGIYIDGLKKTVGGVTADISGFYLVNSVPIGGSGDPIPNELTVMDYDGNLLDTSGWSSWSGTVTIQFGTKIYDIDNYYAVTAVATDNVSQSVLSDPPAHIVNNLDVDGSYNTITWDAQVGVSRYEVYKKHNGLWGFIGETTDTQFVDNNIAPDMGTTPPIYDTVFSAADDYPAAVGYYEQRKAYAGTLNRPQTLWMSRAGTEDNFSYSLPTTDEDRIAVTVATLQRNAVRHIVSLFQMLLLTEGSEIRVSPVNSDTLSPTTISAKPQSYVGASNVVPAIVNNALVYCAARGGHVRELGFSWQANGFTGGFISGDLSLRAAHLFDNRTILDMTHSKSPRPLLWFVSSSGDLLGLTYVPEEQIGAWHRHDTAGAFESVCAIPEGAEDRLYAVIRRVVNGVTVRYVERMASRLFVDQADAFFVDSGANVDGTNSSGTTIHVQRVPAASGPGTRYKLTASTPIFAFPATTDNADVVWFTVQTGVDEASVPILVRLPVTIDSETSTTVAYSAPLSVPSPDLLDGLTTTAWAWARNTFSGLTWLEGKKLSVLADGAVLPLVTVTGGSVTIARPAVKVVLGLPYTCDLGTLPTVLAIDGYGQGRAKNISKAWLRVYRSSGIFIGPDEEHLTEAKQRTTESFGVAPALKSEEVPVLLTPAWQQDGRVLVRQTMPLPLTVVGLTLEVAIGG